jgi:hypothetical protein
MSEEKYLDDVLEKWAIESVCPNNGKPETEYEIRAVHNLMTQGFKLLNAAQGISNQLPYLKEAHDYARLVIDSMSKGENVQKAAATWLKNYGSSHPASQK